jgi:hypothetical protein
MIIKDINYLINIGDLISNSESFVGSKVNIKGLLISQNTIFVQAMPNFVNITLATLSKEMFSHSISGTLLDPMTH